MEKDQSAGKKHLEKKSPFCTANFLLLTWEKGCPDDSKKIHSNFLINDFCKLKKSSEL